MNCQSLESDVERPFSSDLLSDAGEGERYPYVECNTHLLAARRFTNPREATDYRQAIFILKLQLAVSELTRQNKDLLGRIEKLEGLAHSVVVPINTFAPRPFEATREILVLVEPIVDESGEPCEYIASFTDGIISATGDTVEEAVSLLKSRMATQYRLLTQLPAGRLGKIPHRQLAALQAVMRRIG